MGRDAHAGLALVKCQNWHIRDAGIVVKCRSALSRCRFALIAVTTDRYTPSYTGTAIIGLPALQEA